MAQVAERLPSDPTGSRPGSLGQLSTGWYLLIFFCFGLVMLGINAYAQQVTQGEVVTGMRDMGTMRGVPWGLYIVFAVYFIGASFAGITVAALVRLLDITELKPVTRMAELLTVVTIVLGAISILADVGQPLRALVFLPAYARPQSPFFGTFTLVIAGYIFASLVYVYLDGRRDAAVCARYPGPLQGLYRWLAAGYSDSPAERQRHHRTSFWLAIAIVPLLITAHSTLGFIFGLQVGRPGWFSALQAPAFLIMAGVSGIGLLIIIAAILRRVTGDSRINLAVFRRLSGYLTALVVAYLYFMVVEWLTTVYAGSGHEARVMNVLMNGQYATLYWLAVGCLIGALALLVLAQSVFSEAPVAAMVLSGLLVNVAAVVKRYLIVVPSQTHGTLLPYGPGSYSPSWVEYSIILGLVGLGVLVYAVMVRILPIVPLPGNGGDH